MWAILLSFIFTPVFGGIVCGMNWRAMGKEEMSVRSFSFMRSTILIMVLYIFAEPMLRGILICSGVAEPFILEQPYPLHPVRAACSDGRTVVGLDFYGRA